MIISLSPCFFGIQEHLCASLQEWIANLMYFCWTRLALYQCPCHYCLLNEGTPVTLLPYMKAHASFII